MRVQLDNERLEIFLTLNQEGTLVQSSNQVPCNIYCPPLIPQDVADKMKTSPKNAYAVTSHPWHDDQPPELHFRGQLATQ